MRRRRSPAEVAVPPGEIRIIESHHAPGFRMEAGAWAFHKIAWVAVGRGRLDSPEGANAIERDDFLLLPAGWEHRFVDEPGDPLTLVIACISAEYFSANSNAEPGKLWASVLAREAPGTALCARTAFHHTALVERIRRALREQSTRREGWRTAVEAAANALLIRLARGHATARVEHVARAAQAVAGAAEYVDARPHEPLRITDMAERCRLSPRHFTALFRRQTGETFNTYLNRRRVEFAKERLRETGHILYACHESGFNDPAYFYRVFKKFTGVTPGEFIGMDRQGRSGEVRRRR